MTTRLTNLATPFVFRFAVTTAGTPEQLTVKLRAATIAFNDNVASADTITDSGNGFLVAGFQAGDQITVAGSASNNGTFTIASVTAGVITLVARNSLTTTAAGATVTLTASKTVPDGVSVSVKARNANLGVISVGYSSATALNTASSSFTLRNNESLNLQVENTNQIWLDTNTSGESVEVIFEKSLQA